MRSEASTRADTSDIHELDELEGCVLESERYPISAWVELNGSKMPAQMEHSKKRGRWVEVVSCFVEANEGDELALCFEMRVKHFKKDVGVYAKVDGKTYLLSVFDGGECAASDMGAVERAVHSVETGKIRHKVKIGPTSDEDPAGLSAFLKHYRRTASLRFWWGTRSEDLAHEQTAELTRGVQEHYGDEIETDETVPIYDFVQDKLISPNARFLTFKFNYRTADQLDQLKQDAAARELVYADGNSDSSDDEVHDEDEKPVAGPSNAQRRTRTQSSSPSVPLAAHAAAAEAPKSPKPEPDVLELSSDSDDEAAAIAAAQRKADQRALEALLADKKVKDKESEMAAHELEEAKRAHGRRKRKAEKARVAEAVVKREKVEE